MKKILVPVDGSDHSVRAAQFASKLAEASGGTMVLLHVFDEPRVVAMGVAAMGNVDIAELERSASKYCLDKVRSEMGGQEQLECRSALGSPFSTITAIAEEGDFDHIVMGSRGMSPVKELLMGSVSHSVLQHTKCPVTIVR